MAMVFLTNSSTELGCEHYLCSTTRASDFRQGIPDALQRFEDLAEVLNDVGLMQRVAGVYETFGRWLNRVYEAQEGRE
jgi:hypothetical protein